jgi:hypothetical protein
MWAYILESMIWSVGGLAGGYAVIHEVLETFGKNR